MEGNRPALNKNEVDTKQLVSEICTNNIGYLSEPKVK